jgi:CelD/BcsL family acetyltransferase involved in cellulose biosynthesis
MSAASAIASPTPAAATATQPQTFIAQRISDWDTLATDWHAIAARPGPTPFQGAIWLEAWYATFSGSGRFEPVIIDVRDRAGHPAMLLPLALERRGRLRVITFADAELADFNAPVLGPAAPATSAAARRAFAAMKRALPPADLLELKKIPAKLGARDNPLVGTARTPHSAVNGNLVTLPADWNDYHRGLGKAVRGELDRSWRVFQRAAGARFVRVADAPAAARIIAAMDTHQAARFSDAGGAETVTGSEGRAFHRRMATHGLATGEVIVTALEAEGEIVAGLFAYRGEDTVVVTRLANAGGRWSNCSPGRVILHQTMKHLHAEGIRRIDLSIGNHDYKRRFGPVRTPLHDLISPLSPMGLPRVARNWAVGRLRAYPELDRRVRTLLSPT